MLLIRLSGHSGAGKSRLIAALPSRKINCPRAILYTSRPAREGECHGREYYFLSSSAIDALPDETFFKGRVREMIQAVDLKQLAMDLWSSDVVMIEIHHSLWLRLLERLQQYMQRDIPNRSVFMTAVHTGEIAMLPTEEEKATFIRTRVAEILTKRKKDKPDKVVSRAKDAVKEVLEAIGPRGRDVYAKVFDSAPEGPDHEDDWTKGSAPVGDAAVMLDAFIAFYREQTPA